MTLKNYERIPIPVLAFRLTEDNMKEERVQAYIRDLGWEAGQRARVGHWLVWEGLSLTVCTQDFFKVTFQPKKRTTPK